MIKHLTMDQARMLGFLIDQYGHKKGFKNTPKIDASARDLLLKLEAEGMLYVSAEGDNSWEWSPKARSCMPDCGRPERSHPMFDAGPRLDYDAEIIKARGQGMAVAAAMMMRIWGAHTEAREILGAGGLRTLTALREAEVDQYDIDALLPVLDDEEAAPKKGPWDG